MINNRDLDFPSLSITKVYSYENYVNYAREHMLATNENLLFEKNLIPNTEEEFKYNGYCYICNSTVGFIVDFKYAYKVNNVLTPNWREKLLCPVCRLNNRMRAVIHVFNLECRPNSESNIYITEQTTPLFKQFKYSFTNISGSEYLGDTINYGSINQNGIRNEDLKKLTFTNNQFDFILSFDVLEHIPEYKNALAECYRCLKPGGKLFFTVPFNVDSRTNIVRAQVSENGEINHLLPPEYHGDPMNSDGCLCYYHFGWEILEDLKTIGFKNPHAHFYWSRYYGYLGGEHLIFIANKG